MYSPQSQPESLSGSNCCYNEPLSSVVFNVGVDCLFWDKLVNQCARGFEIYRIALKCCYTSRVQNNVTVLAFVDVLFEHDMMLVPSCFQCWSSQKVQIDLIWLYLVQKEPTRHFKQSAVENWWNVFKHVGQRNNFLSSSHSKRTAYRIYTVTENVPAVCYHLIPGLHHIVFTLSQRSRLRFQTNSQKHGTIHRVW